GAGADAWSQFMNNTLLPPKGGSHETSTSRTPAPKLVASAFRRKIAVAAALLAFTLTAGAQQPAIQTPEQFFGFRMGTDNKLARWDKIVDYFKQVSGASDRIRFRELGKSTNGNQF